MELFVKLIFAAIIFVYSYRFIITLIKMKQEIVFPASIEEFNTIRKHPEKPVYPPTYSKQKTGIMIYALTLIYLTAMLIASYFFDFFWSIYLLLILPIFHLSDLFNMFVFVQDGVLCGARFVPWRKIKSFEFVRIDVNHRYYGFSKDVNDQYELKIKTRFAILSCVVTSNEMKERLRYLLEEQRINELSLGKDIIY